LAQAQKGQIMKYALLVVEDEASDVLSTQTAIMNFVRSVQQRLRQTGTVTMLNPFCWLCPLEHGLHALDALVSEARERKYTTRTLFFDQEPSFVVSKP
jgi:hypothetical protein